LRELLFFDIAGKKQRQCDFTKAQSEINEQKEEIQAQSEELIEASEAISNINKELEVKIEDRTSD